ncbi:ATP synthase F0 [Colletotrichum orchidophilum]|uniref:ATP synthase F0 n=1 Tax=Colletotrichum orchidophilum TaxID=1209926 RepID=A0A1G4BNK9_9PEZI|nr:ATP synthase F0 [Colletotrichum orchidophilum]OHF03004.1 ATP synthase F0 [Colletotrichum orchidophilum]
MAPNILPNSSRFILSILSVVSYLPQCHRLREQGHCDGLSLYYVLFNLLSATEQVTIGFFLNVNNDGSLRPDVFVNTPATAGDWFNLGQLVVVWLCSLYLFILCFRYSSANPDRIGHRQAVMTISTLFLLFSVVPVLIDACQPPSRSEPRRWAQDIFALVHYLLFIPMSTAMTILAVIPQVREIRSRRGNAGALSLPGLTVQCVVFALVAISWVFRVKYPPYSPSWVEWYRLIGWPVVNDGLAGCVRGLLLVVALRDGMDEGWESVEGRPLLGV